MSKGRKEAVSMSEAEYVEVFLDPAMQLIAEEKADNQMKMTNSVGICS